VGPAVAHRCPPSFADVVRAGAGLHGPAIVISSCPDPAPTTAATPPPPSPPHTPRALPSTTYVSPRSLVNTRRFPLPSPSPSDPNRTVAGSARLGEPGFTASFSSVHCAGSRCSPGGQAHGERCLY
jgi:hypothetical protein